MVSASGDAYSKLLDSNRIKLVPTVTSGKTGSTLSGKSRIHQTANPIQTGPQTDLDVKYADQRRFDRSQAALGSSLRAN